MVGIGYALIGVVGFIVTGLTGWVVNTDEALLGFDLNGFHNVVHIGVGAILIGASQVREPSVTQGILIGGGLVYLVAAFLGFTEDLDELLSIDGSAAPDNFLHTVSGVLAIAVGLLGGTVSRPRIELP